MSYVRFQRIRAGAYAHEDWRIYFDGDCWIVTNRKGNNWVTNTRTLREARDFITEATA